MKDVREVMRLKALMLQTYFRQYKQHEEALKFFNGDFHILNERARENQKFHEVLLITSRQIVSEIAAQLLPNKFTVEYPPLKDTQREREHSDKLEELAHALLDRWDIIKASNPFAEGGVNLTLYGKTAWRTLWDDKAWGSRPLKWQFANAEDFEYQEALWEAERSTRLPFSLHAIDPLNMLPSPTTPLKFMIEHYRVKPFLIQEDFPNMKVTDPFKDMDLTTYWDKDTWRYISGAGKGPGQQELRTSPVNIYGIIPYVVAWSGLGKTSPKGHPEQKAVGLIWPLIPLLQEESRAVTSVSIIMQSLALGRTWSRGEVEPNIGTEPGSHTHLPEGTQFDYFENPPVSKDLYTIMSVAGQQIERYVGEKLLGGQRPAGVSSAMFEVLLLEKGKRRYATLIQSMENAYANVIAQQMYLLEHVIKEQIPGCRVKPSDIRGYYKPVIRFQYEDLAERRIRAMIARMLFQTGLIDFRTAHNRDYLNTENVTEVREGLLEDKIYQNPELITAMAIKLMEKRGLTNMLQEATANMAQANQGIPASGEERQMMQKLMRPIGGGQIPPEGFSGGGMGYGEGFDAGISEEGY